MTTEVPQSKPDPIPPSAPGPLPWQWSEQQWRSVVSHVRAGRALRPATWPGGARCAVALSFDVDHETGELRDGGSSIGRLSQGEFGHRVGLPSILTLLRRHGVRASFFVPAVAGLLYPQEPRQLIDEGHEVGMHGWIHEYNSLLPQADERELMLRSADTLTRLCSVRPCGIRTPSWDFSPHTLGIIREMGLVYDSSLMSDVDCYELLLDGVATGVVELPVEWIRDDAVYFGMHRAQAIRPHTAPAAVLEIFRAEFAAAYAQGGLFQLTMHPHIIGHRSRLWLLDELVREILSHAGVWCATHAEVVAHVRTQSLGAVSRSERG